MPIFRSKSFSFEAIDFLYKYKERKTFYYEAPFTSKQKFFFHFYYKYNSKELLIFLQVKGNASFL